MTPKVSVCITTYNHEKWISQAIESVLSQRTDFPFEILIGEDDSEDKTREIVRDYAKRYPMLIRAFLNDRKNVVYIDGFATGRWNFINNLNNARGEYIAMLEGDDYWYDPNKLQKQVELMDGCEEHAICFHDALIEEPDGRLIPDYITRKTDTITTISDLAKGNYIHTPTCLYRRRNLINTPPWLWKTRIGDYPLHMLNACHGSIYKIHEAMSVYRNTGLGVHSSLSMTGKREAMLQTLEVLIGEFDGEIRNSLIQNLISLSSSLFGEYLDTKQCAKIEDLVATITKHSPSSVAEAFAQRDVIRSAFARTVKHPITGPFIALVRRLKRDPSFGRIPEQVHRD